MINTARVYNVNDNDGEIIWNISSKSGFLNNVLNAKNKQQFGSNIISIGQFKWQMIMTPNGMDKESIGSCDIFLNLISMPSKYNQITILMMIKCPQTHSSYTTMCIYKIGQSFGWPPGTQSLAELKFHQNTNIQFIIVIKILSMSMASSNTISSNPSFINKSAY